MNENWEEIVWRALRNECSSEELMKLQEWRNEAPENEQMYEDIKGIMEMGSFLKGMDSLHKENALENILKRTRQRSLGYSRILKYAAVLLLPLLLGGTLFYVLTFNNKRVRYFLYLSRNRSYREDLRQFFTFQMVK